MKPPITIKEMNSNMKGFSLVELLIVTVILVITLGIISGIISRVQKSYNEQRPRIEAVSDANAALDTIGAADSDGGQ